MIKYPGLKIIWGGPHCISVPEFGLRHADGICFSEGDEAVVELVNAMSRGNAAYLETPNMAFMVNGTPRINRVLPPFQDLDRLPYYDYCLEDQYILDRGLHPMTREGLREHLAGYPYYIPILYIVTSRGCPNHCIFCLSDKVVRHSSVPVLVVP